VKTRRWLIGVLSVALAFVLVTGDAAAQKDKKKDKKEKEEKFEKTGTSADAFLKAAWEMGRDFKQFNARYDEVKLYVHMLLTQPSNVIGKDVASVVTAAQSAGTVPASIQVKELNGLVTSKGDALKEIKDAVVKNSVTQFVSDLNAMTGALAKMPEDVARLIAEAAALPDKLEKEMTGLQKAKLPKTLDKVNDGKSNLTTIKDEAPTFATNVSEMIALLTALAATLGS
jgi:hypothetical protein